MRPPPPPCPAPAQGLHPRGQPACREPEPAQTRLPPASREMSPLPVRASASTRPCAVWTPAARTVRGPCIARSIVITDVEPCAIDPDIPPAAGKETGPPSDRPARLSARTRGGAVRGAIRPAPRSGGRASAGQAPRASVLPRRCARRLHKAHIGAEEAGVIGRNSGARSPARSTEKVDAPASLPVRRRLPANLSCPSLRSDTAGGEIVKRPSPAMERSTGGRPARSGGWPPRRPRPRQRRG